MRSSIPTPGQPGANVLALSSASSATPDTRSERVLHLVGRITAEVLSFLEPATAALANQGIDQAVLTADLPEHQSRLQRLQPHAELLLVPHGGNAWQHWRALLRALVEQIVVDPPTALHAHGFVPALVGALALRKTGLRVRMVYSPHGSRSLGGLSALGTLLIWLLRPMAGGLPLTSAIASCSAEPPLLERQTRAPVHLAESPIREPYFDLYSVEASRPLILTGALNDSQRGAERVARLAVLLGDDVVRARLVWLGPRDKGADDLLSAAGVQTVDDDGADEAADLLSTAWVYVAPTAASHFPLLLAEAMSAGLPCVAMDSRFHRALIRDGETGFLCDSDDMLITRIVALLDAPVLRRRIGSAAREEARKRFDGQAFRQSLLTAYAADLAPPRAEPHAPARAA